MSDTNNTLSGNDADEPQLRVADDTLLAQIRDRTEPAAGDEPLVLRFIRFTGADLRGVHLSHAEIRGSVFDSADLSDARFVGARIEACSFVAARLPRVVFTDAEVSLVNFTHADMEGADFRSASLQDVNFRDADLSRSIFDEGAAKTNFLDAISVQGMDVTRMDEFALKAPLRLKLHELGARAHIGFRCPRCEAWDGHERGIDPTCSLCGAVGFVDFDPEEKRREEPLDCPWCGGSGAYVTFTGSSGCLYCDGLGKLGTWAIDRNQFDEFIPGDVYEYHDGVDYPSMKFAETDFSEAWFEDGHIEDIVFRKCSFEHASFKNAVLRKLRFLDCDLRDATLVNASLQNVSLAGCLLAKSDWPGATFDGVHADPNAFADATIGAPQLADLAPVD
jgi:uncharacterized protein YjbI with pentapeptide repeats